MFSSDHPAAARYRALRAAGKTWSPKILRHPASKPFDLLKAARKLGLPVEDRTIVFDNETEMDVLTDFHLFDYRPAGENVVESCTFSPGELTPLETEFHQAALAARSSLFEAVTAHGTEPKTLLRDRLDPAAPEFWLTDIGLSASLRRLGRAFLFTRVVSRGGMSMTTGAAFIFDPRHESTLIDGCRRFLWTAATPAQRSTRRMIYYFGQNRRIGSPIALKNIAPSSPSKNSP